MSAFIAAHSVPCRMVESVSCITLLFAHELCAKIEADTGATPSSFLRKKENNWDYSAAWSSFLATPRTTSDVGLALPIS